MFHRHDTYFEISVRPRNKNCFSPTLHQIIIITEYQYCRHNSYNADAKECCQSPQRCQRAIHHCRNQLRFCLTADICRTVFPHCTIVSVFMPVISATRSQQLHQSVSAFQIMPDNSLSVMQVRRFPCIQDSLSAENHCQQQQHCSRTYNSFGKLCFL